jgi:hypothetical protein
VEGSFLEKLLCRVRNLFATDDRPVLVHYHIFKNAGTSVDAALQSSFGEQWIEFEGAPENLAMRSAQLSEFVLTHPQIRALSSHKARPPFLPNSYPIIFLRHPIARVDSAYKMTKRDPNQLCYPIVKDMTLSEYVRWALDGGYGGQVILNYQVVHLSEASFRSGLDAAPEDLMHAKELLRSIGIVGIVEDFDASMARFQALYGRVFPELEMRPAVKNVSDGAPKPLSEAIAAIRSELGPELFAELEAANGLDLELYEFARAMA